MANRPSSWVNLQDYLGLNADQGQDMGNNVYGNIQDQATAAGTKLTSDQKDFNQQSAAGTLQGPSAPTEYGDGRNADPTTVQQSATNALGGYTGPNNLTDVDSGIEGQVGDAVAKMQQASDPNQRGGVIQETYGAKSASGIGGNAMDSFLSGQGQAGQNLNSLGAKYQDLQNSLGLTENDAYNTAQKATTTSQANAAQWGSTAVAANNAPILQQARSTYAKAIQQYTQSAPGDPGTVLGIGSSKDFLAAMNGGGGAGDTRNAMTGNTTPNEVRQNAATASSALGISTDQFKVDAQKMNAQEWQDFWTLGVVPGWMTAPGVPSSKRGAPGGWASPISKLVAGYGDNGGIQQGVDNFDTSTAAGMAKAAMTVL